MAAVTLREMGTTPGLGPATDGRANVPSTPGGEARPRRGVTETGHMRLGRAAPLAEVPGTDLTTLGATA